MEPVGGGGKKGVGPVEGGGKSLVGRGSAPRGRLIVSEGSEKGSVEKGVAVALLGNAPGENSCGRREEGWLYIIKRKKLLGGRGKGWSTRGDRSEGRTKTCIVGEKSRSN